MRQDAIGTGSGDFYFFFLLSSSATNKALINSSAKFC